jgi:ubiquinone/menaquinone biosynthesis C-methylase UbiE
MWKSIIILCVLAAATVHTGFTQENKDYLVPANDGEARLNRLQPPDKVMDIFGIKPGMVVAEIGAGKGRYVVHLADRVGPEGKVYAEDINRESLEICEKRCREGGLENVEIINGEETDPLLPKAKLDMIFIISAYHHFEDPVTLMKNAKKALKPGGMVAIGEWVKKSGQRLGEGRSPDQLELEMKRAGYRLKKTDKSLKGSDMYLYLFEIDRFPDTL